MARALYRQYRPKTFNEVLGQDRVTTVLKNQVKTGKISHAYIFSGERGTGKTSCAKIFAKAVNCLNPKDGNPCLECENCRAIEEETTIDVVEMDAASNRRIDDIRNLKDNVIYPPNKLAYKVYIIDEAHMITREAFNALLKIMEEPPNHLIFILATTELEKIPTTILSRVQKFEFNKIDENKIREQIDKILTDKAIKMENEAIDLIIKKAGGAMRDALSILDTVISLEEESYSLSEVEAILGVVDFYDVDKLAAAIISKNPADTLGLIKTLRANNKSNRDILDSLISYFEDIMIYRLTADDKHFENAERLGFIETRADEISDLEAADYLDILIDYKTRMKLAENTDVLTEVCMLRLINLKDIKSLEGRIRYLEKQSGENLVDEINKILDMRLRNIDLSAVANKAPAVDEAGSMKEPHLANEPSDIKEPKEIREALKPDPAPAPAETNDEEASLSREEEAAIKQMLLKVCGGVLNGLFNDEGFNYNLTADKFIIYVEDDFYKIFIETKRDAVSDEISRILKKDLSLEVESQAKNDNNITHTEENKTVETKKVEKEEIISPQIDNTAKLRDIFGDDLVIE